MAVWSVIRKSQLEGASRLDAEYYQPEYLALIKTLRSKATLSLSSVAFITDGIHASIDYDDKSKIRILSAQSVKDNFFDLSANTYISEDQHRKNLRTSLKSGDVMLSSVGTIGNCATVTDDILPANADRHIGLIRLSSDKISAGYLSTFLNSKYGRVQTIREATGNVQLNLFIDKIKTLIVPIVKNHKEISELVQQAHKLLKDSETLYAQAEQMLLDELGLKDLILKDELFYTASLSEVKTNRRLDAEYFKPKYDQIIQRIKKYKNGWMILTEKVKNITTKFEPSKTPDQEFNYIELENVSANLGVVDGCNIVKGMDAPSRAQRLVKTNDIIVSSIKGALDKVALISDKYNSALASTGFFLLRTEYFLPACLLVLMKSKVIQEQLDKEAAGTILSAVPKDSLDKIYLPLLNKGIQQKLSDLVIQSHQARDKARQLLAQAKQKVEDLIEKG